MEHRFHIMGTLEPLLKGELAGVSRPIAGWFTTYGQIGTDGSVIPTEDREGQVMDAARSQDIDWSGLQWFNDRHDRGIIIGRPISVEYHDERSPFAQKHGKVGYYGTGMLFDPADPVSFGDYKPTARDLRQADWYWGMRENPGGLGFSVDGAYQPSPDRKQIVWAKVDQVALHPTPHNPDASVDILGAPVEWLRKGGDAVDAAFELPKGKQLIVFLCEHYGLTEADAKDFIRRVVEARFQGGMNGNGKR